MAYEVDDFYKLMNYAEKLKLEVLMIGIWFRKHTWVYLTTRDNLKHIVELNYRTRIYLPKAIRLYPAK